MAYGGIWWHMVAYGGIWWHIEANDVELNTNLYQIFKANRHMVAYGGIWWHMVAYGGIWWHMVAYSGTSSQTQANAGE